MRVALAYSGCVIYEIWKKQGFDFIRTVVWGGVALVALGVWTITPTTEIVHLDSFPKLALQGPISIETLRAASKEESSTLKLILKGLNNRPPRLIRDYPINDSIEAGSLPVFDFIQFNSRELPAPPNPAAKALGKRTVPLLAHEGTHHLLNRRGIGSSIEEELFCAYIEAKVGQEIKSLWAKDPTDNLALARATFDSYRHKFREKDYFNPKLNDAIGELEAKGYLPIGSAARERELRSALEQVVREQQ